MSFILVAFKSNLLSTFIEKTLRLTSQENVHILRQWRRLMDRLPR